MTRKSGNVAMEPSTSTGAVEATAVGSTAPTTGAVAAAPQGPDRPVHLPQISAEVREDGTGEISVDGVRESIAMADLAEAGAAITGRIAALAAEAGRPLPVEVRDPDGLWALLIHPDGRVDEADETDLAALSAPVPVVDPAWSQPDPLSAPTPVVPTGATPAVPTGATPAVPTGATPAVPHGAPPAVPSHVDADPVPSGEQPVAPEPVAAAPTAESRGAARGETRAERRADTGSLPTLDDLLAARHPAHEGPAEHGWQRTVRRLTLGAVKPQPGAAERARRSQVGAIRRTFDGPRTVVVVNPKGGAHKTTATMLLASTFGLARGGYTLAWDNNETRGTLGWRSSHADHQRTAVDLLHALPDLTQRGTLRIGDLDSYVRTQQDEQFDVLASDENAASIESVDAASYRALHDVLTQFYRVLVVDTGNNMRASNWQAAVQSADQLVVVSTLREDTAQSAAWALDALRATGQDELVRQAVTILSFPEPKVDKDLRHRLRSHFGALTRAVVEVPHDKALVTGGPIDHAQLRPATRDAWLRATAIVADGL
ncbi:chromosome partitioning protein [Cellulomonas xiejunii]|uniref:Chromosome partitioning protein n=1 Tax=Cellulomonas xiejunii TaxID=2968083 RepID=A0ABY5KRX9_9CELL|nr:chromosome partitioning protein [Cellulomonas xiejunii]MCC2313901.1 chromosome partitioning protein [Cellulomonas xiejunii]MCC2322454.1 chromosome partitioning protein [Cellulomonas xiejunii]UUI72498.1 chromosome partitioning protein [Cellulomonas xiejunii]